VSTTTEQLVERLSTLPVSMLSDCLDKLGARGHVMDNSIRPVAGVESLSGVAFPLQAVARPLGEPAACSALPTYNKGIDAVDAIVPGSVVVIATGGFCGAAGWGELLATRARALGGIAVVTDGAVRDVSGLRRMEFPTYAAALCPLDAQDRMAVTAYGEAVVCGGAAVHPGDLVRADADGVVVLPRAIAEQIIVAAEEHRSGEDVVKRDLREGRSAAAVFDDYGIL
jgi:4-hydroxy-4-methyl-2-oxoglutarate aldolase